MGKKALDGIERTEWRREEGERGSLINCVISNFFKDDSIRKKG